MIATVHRLAPTCTDDTHTARCDRGTDVREQRVTEAEEAAPWDSSWDFPVSVAATAVAILAFVALVAGWKVGVQ